MANFKYLVHVFLKDGDKRYLFCNSMAYDKTQNAYIFTDGKTCYDVFFEEYYVAREDIFMICKMKNTSK